MTRSSSDPNMGSKIRLTRSAFSLFSTFTCNGLLQVKGLAPGDPRPTFDLTMLMLYSAQVLCTFLFLFVGPVAQGKFQARNGRTGPPLIPTPAQFAFSPPNEHVLRLIRHHG